MKLPRHRISLRNPQAAQPALRAFFISLGVLSILALGSLSAVWSSGFDDYDAALSACDQPPLAVVDNDWFGETVVFDTGDAQPARYQTEALVAYACTPAEAESIQTLYRGTATMAYFFVFTVPLLIGLAFTVAWTLMEIWTALRAKLKPASAKR